MLKRLTIGICSLMMFAVPAHSQTCETAKLAAAIDRYASEPFSARTWRMLQGHGDPMIDAIRWDGEDSANNWSNWKQLTAELAPDLPGLQSICRIDYPLQVLLKRVGSLGRDHPYVKQWLMAQEKVALACGRNGSADLALPPPLEIDAAFIELQKQDRAYQEASIAFYRDKEKAVDLFRAIVNSKSQHRAAARYNIANLLANAKQPIEARAEAEAILADPSLASVHTITRRLLGYIANQEDTAEGWTKLIEQQAAILETPADKILTSDSLSRDYANALYDIDYIGVRAKDDDWWLDGKLPENPTISKALADASRKHPMVLWMMAGQSANTYYRYLPWSLIGEKWQARLTTYIDKVLNVQPSGSSLNGPALAMLVAMKARPDDQTRKALWDAAKAAAAAAEQSCGTDPQTAAAGFLLSHAVRLSAISGQFDEAYAGLASVPFKSSRSYSEGSVLRLGQYLLGQGNLAEARRMRDRLIDAEFLAAHPARTYPFTGERFSGLLGWIAENEDHWREARKLDWKASAHPVFDFLPAKRLWTYAYETHFTPDERAMFARMAWTRDYALGRAPAVKHTKLLHSLNLGVAAIAAKTAADYPTTRAERQRLLAVLRTPHHNILANWWVGETKQEEAGAIDTFNHNDRNWWCPMEPDRLLAGLHEDATRTIGIDDYWLAKLDDVYDPALGAVIDENRVTVMKQHPMVKAINWAEVEKLSRMPSAPQKLTKAAIRWGKASKGNDGAPEALALAVRATRYGCNWHGGHGAYSKEAQMLLQKKFKDTVWAKQTPYWFDCMRRPYEMSEEERKTCAPKQWPKAQRLN